MCLCDECVNVNIEFRRQLSCLQSMVERVPQCIVHRLLQSALTDSRSSLLHLHAEFLGFHSEYIIQKVSHFHIITLTRVNFVKGRRRIKHVGENSFRAQ